ncbi:MAG: sigma-70 family RNA polymerase sigma factor [Clostridia bacterium]|nr:sigma-70 family RNA polymerase sigma factor [Clostridia bacterium]
MINDDFNILTDETLVVMAREGSSTAYEYLIAKYRDLAKSKARKYYITGADREDVIQEGMIGIFKAVRDFDTEAETRFSTFVSLCIERQIKSAISGANREKHRILNESISLSQTIDSDAEGRDADDSKPLSGEDLIAGKEDDPEEMALVRDAIATVKKAGRREFSGLEAEVFDQMLTGRTYREIAEALGKDPKKVDNAIQRVKKKIRRKLGDY